ncbi:MAG: flagellar basal body L-ring protein FlgH [Leptospirales bacterium]
MEWNEGSCRGWGVLLFLAVLGCTPVSHSGHSGYPVVTDQAPRRLPPVPVQPYFDGSLYRPEGLANLASDQTARTKGESLWIRIPEKNGLPGFSQAKSTLIGGMIVRTDPPDELVIFARKTIRKHGEVKRWILEGRIRREDIGHDNIVSMDKLSMARYRYDHKTPHKRERFAGKVRILPPYARKPLKKALKKAGSAAVSKVARPGPPPIQGGAS